MSARKEQDELIAVPEHAAPNAHIKGMHNYLATWEKSVDSVDEFWGGQAPLPDCWQLR